MSATSSYDHLTSQKISEKNTEHFTSYNNSKNQAICLVERFRDRGPNQNFPGYENTAILCSLQSTFCRLKSRKLITQFRNIEKVHFWVVLPQYGRIWECLGKPAGKSYTQNMFNVFLLWLSIFIPNTRKNIKQFTNYNNIKNRPF